MALIVEGVQRLAPAWARLAGRAWIKRTRAVSIAGAVRCAYRRRAFVSIGGGVRVFYVLDEVLQAFFYRAQFVPFFNAAKVAKNSAECVIYGFHCLFFIR